MSSHFSFGSIQFQFGSNAATSKPEPESPFALAIVGDFSGRAHAGKVEPIGERKLVHVDCDNFEQTFTKIKPSLSGLQLRSMEDFHPDNLLKNVRTLASSVEKRQELLKPAQDAQSVQMASPLPQAETPARHESDTDTLSRLLGGPAPQSAPSTTKTISSIEQLIKRIARPSIVPEASPRQRAELSLVELETAKQLRELLHQPDFQALEAAWRGLDFLVRAFGAEENLKLYLLDISKEELAADLQQQEQLEGSGCWRLLRQQMDEQPLAAWIGLYTFADSIPDVQLLGRIAKISARSRSPFISGAAPRLVGCDSFASHNDPDDWNLALSPEFQDAWRALRGLPESGFVSLALPRFLLRQPYGRNSDAIESFPFEEMPGAPFHENYLWGNSALLCAYLLADGFRAEGWEMRLRGFGEVSDLPVHSFTVDGERHVKPCAEAWLSERAGEAIAARGLVPVLSVRGRDSVRVEELRSLREPGAPLAGRWQ